MKMSEEAKLKMKAIPLRRCFVCNSCRSYTNPLTKCSVCGKFFCYDHIRTKIEEKGVIDYCDEHFPKK